MLLFLVAVAVVGAGLSIAVLWLPVLLLGIFLFMAVLIYTLPTKGVWPALGFGALAVLTLQFSYIVAGFLLARSDRATAASGLARRIKHAHSKK